MAHVHAEKQKYLGEYW